MKPEEAKKLQNVFKSNLNKISSGKYKSEEQKAALDNIKLLEKCLKNCLTNCLTKLLLNYLMIIFQIIKG